MSTPAPALSTIDQRSPPSPQTISVVVPCHNAAATIGSLLEALAGQTMPPDEVIVVDDGSTDETVGVVARAQSLLARLKITTLKHRRRSIPATLNAGIAAATGGIIVRLDAHSVPDADYIERAIAALRSTGAGVVGGRWRIRPGTSGAMAQAIALAVSHPLGAGDAAYRLCHEGGTPRRVETVPFGVFRRDVWLELGGFDESLLANEDYEFNYRVRLSGRDVVLDPAIVSAYSSRPTLRELSRQYFRYG
ncbi:MAG: glycosyltransferase family 2 protein, partial [Acidobacteria bacterium]|nr:glycosyltransferase family 2 protein [Acidobacteriota bacterium]